jgi:hypothetical protein
VNPTLTFSALLGVTAASLAIGCKGPTCASSDLDCFLAHMVLVEPKQGGKPIELTKIERSTLPSTSNPPVCTSGTLCNASCVDLQSDRGNCGSCNTVCDGGKHCNLGACLCDASCVSPSGQCADLQTDSTNCGFCGNVCPGGTVCSAGACVDACGPGFEPCAQGCAKLASDDLNCGSCGNVCPPGHSCSGGVCTCFAMICMPPEGTPPAITNQPPPMEIAEGSELQPLDLEWNDPNGCQPAFCTHLCSKGRCSNGFVCSRPKNDKLLSGVFRSYLGFLAEPTDGDVQLDTGIVPVSAPDCPEDLLDKIAEGDVTVDVGVEVTVAVTIDEPVSGSSSSGGGGVYCSDPVATCNCSVKACTNSGNSCWYESTNGRFDCDGCDAGCQGAANALVQSCCPTP